MPGSRMPTTTRGDDDDVRGVESKSKTRKRHNNADNNKYRDDHKQHNHKASTLHATPQNAHNRDDGVDQNADAHTAPRDTDDDASSPSASSSSASSHALSSSRAHGFTRHHGRHALPAVHRSRTPSPAVTAPHAYLKDKFNNNGLELDLALLAGMLALALAAIDSARTRARKRAARKKTLLGGGGTHNPPPNTPPSSCDALPSSSVAALADAAPDAATYAQYRRLRFLYLVSYTLGTFGDWMQGGYIYALYAAHGYSIHQIAALFVVGFGSAATCGTYVSALGDVIGHKRNCIAYGVLYALSCALGNSASSMALVTSRILGGVAYSILFTSFESWLIAEATARSLPPQLRARLFSSSAFYYALTAVVAGFAGHLCVEMYPLTDGPNKYVAPFNYSIPPLLLSAALIALTWREPRLGRAREAGATVATSLAGAWASVSRSRMLMSIGLVSALYETALYVFVFIWTPALERRAAHTMSHGLVFATFMLWKMVGTQLHVHLEATATEALKVTFLLSASSIVVPLVTSSYEACLFAFALFEMSLGIYWPAIATLRSDEISDEMRASTMAVFRILLNVFVVTSLLLVGYMSEAVSFMLTGVLLLVCLALTVGIIEKDALPTGWRVSTPVVKPLPPVTLAVGPPGELPGRGGEEGAASSELSRLKGSGR